MLSISLVLALLSDLFLLLRVLVAWVPVMMRFVGTYFSNGPLVSTFKVGLEL